MSSDRSPWKSLQDSTLTQLISSKVDPAIIYTTGFPTLLRLRANQASSKEQQNYTWTIYFLKYLPGSVLHRANCAESTSAPLPDAGQQQHRAHTTPASFPGQFTSSRGSSTTPASAITAPWPQLHWHGLKLAFWSSFSWHLPHWKVILMLLPARERISSWALRAAALSSASLWWLSQHKATDAFYLVWRYCH